MENKSEFVRRSRIGDLRHYLLGIGLILVLGACDRSVPAKGNQMVTPITINAIRVTPARVNIAVGQTLQLSATLGDAAGNMLPKRMATPALKIHSETQSQTIGDRLGRTGRIVTWSSSQPSRAEVDGAGLVTAVAVGHATITATSEGLSASADVIVSGPPVSPLSVVPAGASLSAGESLQLTATSRDAGAKMATGPVTWSADPPSRVTVSKSGLVTAVAPGTVTITAQRGGQSGRSSLTIVPAKTIFGLDFPGSAGVNKTMRFEFTTPPSAYPATYIWRVYPRQQQSYYSAFFWGNNGPLYGSNTYYGFHPYPDWNTPDQHFWEITAPGGDFVSNTHVTYDRWYIQVAICKQSGNKTVEEFYWDWPDTSKVVRHPGDQHGDPPAPAVIVGDAPWNPGHEVWDGILRGFQFYDAAMSPDEIAMEIAAPGAVRKPWYLNLDPTPEDISDKSGNGHHPAWVGTERPALWSGKLIGDTIIRTATPPR
jgi:hypothetical protein